jgi:hypothetical protein
MVPGQYSLHFASMIEECRFFLCSKEDHTLQYVVLSNEVGLSPFLLILVPWLFLVLWRSSQNALGSFIWYYWCCCFLILREVLTLLPLESWIFRPSVSRWDKASATTFFCFFPGRYSNVTPFSSRRKSQHIRKMQSEAFKPLKVLFLWSVKTIMGYW